MRKISKEEFILKAKEIHGDKYDYSCVSYVNNRTNIMIGCPTHGYFEQTPKNHLNKQGCPNCGLEICKNIQRSSKDEFIEKANVIHNNRYDYSKVNYINSKTSVLISCPVHGDFKQKPNDHLDGHGCKKCAFENMPKSTKEEFIERASMVHGNKYNYSKVEYINSDEKVCIICPVHGEFNQTPANHLSGRGCKKCATDKTRQIRIKPFELFKNELIEKYGDKFITDESEFVDMSTLMNFKCKLCGTTSLRKPTSLLAGGDCKLCATRRETLKKLKTTEQFIIDAVKVHGDKYDYSDLLYSKSDDDVDVKCNDCGRNFIIKANVHLRGQGCPYHFCNKSKQEKEIVEYIKSFNVGYDVDHNVRNLIKGYEFDIYIPNKKLAIEFNGLYWHNELNKTTNYHLEKTIKCDERGIKLLHIFEDEWLYKKDIVKSIIRNNLGLNSTSIYGRKCTIKLVGSKEGKDFLNENHVQGYVGSKIRMGLYYEGELVSLMTFGSLRKCLGVNHKEDSYELLRFCNKLNTTVVGGASKLFAHFIKDYNPSEVISYADRRWSQGKLYSHLSFSLYNKSVPNYFYVIGNKRYHRYSFRKDVLIEKYGCPSTTTEKEFCFSKKWYRIYDCGCLCYIWKKQ